MKIHSKSILSLFILLGLSTAGIAGDLKVHTWHTVSSKNGVWQGSLKMINQGGSFVARNGSTIDSFTISESAPYDYGFIFDPENTFDVAYTLTLTEITAASRFHSKACVYVITAKGPAQPDIRPESYNDAKCEWVIVPKIGENFTVS